MREDRRGKLWGRELERVCALFSCNKVQNHLTLYIENILSKG